MKVTLFTQSSLVPIVHDKVFDTHTRDGFYVVRLLGNDHVFRYPINSLVVVDESKD